MKKILIISFSLLLLFLGRQASAHAVVSPNQANVGEFTNFSLGVPSEKPIATVAVKLIIPPGLKYVTPFVKPGWNIDVKKVDGGVSEISWSKGRIPAEQKDQFMFSAQVPGQAITLLWKTYQTYQDGSVVAWDQEADAKDPSDFSNTGPYSKTNVINDLAKNTATTDQNQTSKKAATALVLSSIGILLSLAVAIKKS